MKLTSIAILASLCLAVSLWGQNGLKAEYYNGTEFNELVTIRTEQNIDQSWNDVPPVKGIDPHHCSIRWTGQITSPQAGTYTFSASVDDGIRVWVGGVLVIDKWDLNDDGRFSGQVIMRENTSYHIKVEYFNALVEGEVKLRWKLPDAQQAAIIEPSYFVEKPKTKLSSPSPNKMQDQVAKPNPKARQPSTTSPKPQRQEIPKTESSSVVLPKDTLERYVPKNVLFEQGKPIMLEISKPSLDKLAGFLERNPQYKLKVEGHTDIIGDTDMNQSLSEERANVVAEYLTSKGIDQGRIVAKGYGSSRPLVKGNSKKGYPENRRVAFILY